MQRALDRAALSRPPAMPRLPGAVDEEEQQREAKRKAEYRAELERQMLEKAAAAGQEGAPRSSTDLDDEFRIHAPTPDDLFGLLKLCGSDDKVIDYLARLWGMDSSSIAPTVRGWIKALPAVPPPSRQRSAPPLLSPAVTAYALARAPAATRAMRPPDVLRVEPPPSAPVQSSREAVIMAMRGLDARLNQNAAAKYSLMNGGPSLRGGGAQRVVINPLGRLPEHALVDYSKGGLDLGEAGGAVPEAAEAYIARMAMVHGQGRLAPTSMGAGTKRGETSTSWMTRAVKPVKF